MNYFYSFQLFSVSLLSWTNQHFSVPNLQVLLLLFLQRGTRWICSCFLWFNNSELNLKSFPHDLHSKFAVSRSFLDFIWLNQQFWSQKSKVPFVNLQQIDTLSVCMFFVKSFLLRKVSSQSTIHNIHKQCFLMTFPVVYHIRFCVKPLTTNVTVKTFVKKTFTRLIMWLLHMPVQFLFTCCNINA